MRTVNIARLKARLSEYIRAARSGEAIRILDRRREVARLSGVRVRKDEHLAEALVREGLAQWQGGKPVVKPVKPRKGPAFLADAVLEDRG